MKYFILLLPVIWLAFSCNGTKKAGKALTSTTLNQGNSSAIHESRVQLISTAADWEALWAEMNAHREPVEELPKVNFEEKMLVAAFRGDCGSGGYGLEIQSVEGTKKALKVNVLYTTPGKNCMSTMMITQPYEIVTIDRVTSKAIQVNVEDKVIDCEEETILEEDEPTPFTYAIKWEEVASGAYCGVNEEKRMLIKDQASWIALWEQVGSTRIPPPELPKVNFEEKVLLALFMGDRSNGGYGQSIDRIEVEKERLVVRVIHGSPGANCITTSAIVQPYNIVAIDKKYAYDASFTIEKVKRDCD